MSSLGFQIVYHLLNEDDRIVCERVFLPNGNYDTVRSIESARPLSDFPILFCSISFEHDYLNLAKLLYSSGIELLAERRDGAIASGSPLVVCGGVATFMNPEPLASLIDLFVLGEAEPLLPPLVNHLCLDRDQWNRDQLLSELNRSGKGYYAPRYYQPKYDENGQFQGYIASSEHPARIKKVILESRDHAGHSELLTPETEFGDLYLTELGRGCSRGCRFCTAGFIYRPARLWKSDAVLASLEQCPGEIDRIGLLGMEMTSEKAIEAIAELISSQNRTLSFSSLRADRISPKLLSLLAKSDLKSVAIAPDGGSERLRTVINKNLTEEDLLQAATRLVEAGLFKLKLYLMIGLPTETDDDLDEFIGLVHKIVQVIGPIGRKRGRLTEVTISVNSFVPKPWTPFQYHPFGVSEQLQEGDSIPSSTVVRELKGKLVYLKKQLAPIANTRMTADNPEHVVFQAILARGDRRLGPLLIDMAASGISWKRAMKQHRLQVSHFATRQYGEKTLLPWHIIDHDIDDSWLWKEYCKSFETGTAKIGHADKSSG